MRRPGVCLQLFAFDLTLRRPGPEPGPRSASPNPRAQASETPGQPRGGGGLRAGVSRQIGRKTL